VGVDDDKEFAEGDGGDEVGRQLITMSRSGSEGGRF
jgi:hypothetical protein